MSSQVRTCVGITAKVDKSLLSLPGRLRTKVIGTNTRSWNTQVSASALPGGFHDRQGQGMTMINTANDPYRWCDQHQSHVRAQWWRR